ncbi:MAG: Lrp/AsnC family transcriptional regulator [Candidatus Methanofastidiosa archaeon]|nr:Lrp/AsnC family transcriptional regulator [Candidatus Methanofastidiosa archaeon]
MESKLCDDKDLRIIEALKKDGRKPTSKLSKELGIPRVTIHQRINKMVSNGIIKKFTVHPDYNKLNMPVTAFILISFDSNAHISQRELASKIALMGGIEEVFIISGEWDLILKVRARSAEDVGSIIIDKLRTFEGVGKTTTCISFSAIKED